MILIDEIPSLRDPESFEVNFDDRIEQVKLIKGNAVQDYGHIDSGDVFILTCAFRKKYYDQLKRLWIGREKVSFTDEAGIEHSDMRLVFKKAKYMAKFPDYVELTLELWKV